jgi:hypothetical protein
MTPCKRCKSSSQLLSSKRLMASPNSTTVRTQPQLLPRRTLIMRILFEVLLLSIVIGAVVVFYKIVISYLFPKKKEKNDGE